MKKIQRSIDGISSILSEVKKMASRYRQIGLAEPEDIVQEAMLKVLKKKDKNAIGHGWLYLAVQSSARDAGRKASRDRRLIQKSAVLSVSEPTVSYGERLILRSEAEDNLSRLSKPQREALVLFAEGHEYEEIARMTDAKIGTVRSRLYSRRSSMLWIERRAWWGIRI